VAVEEEEGSADIRTVIGEGLRVDTELRGMEREDAAPDGSEACGDRFDRLTEISGELAERGDQVGLAVRGEERRTRDHRNRVSE
jgi:hypothetical protein